jgi:hypothetical protein
MMSLFPLVIDDTSASHFGWSLGIASGTVFNILLIVLIALAPALEDTAPPALVRRRRFRQGIAGLIVGLGLIDFCGALRVERPWRLSYVQALAEAGAITIFVVIAICMFTAANQIGTRGVR